ncbi:FAD/NAD(P)-binding protein [Paracoccus aminophilus]|uniref:FAD-dependent urate hydroxylase HpyO/Asp monooxygenase CreE-like FAD/NAD(P)-binding domain-containing protein n=1 Tax=Paracoccus aminophilus JCM 7686 TaxID=1367847 RepID=S5XQW9_PARAH|nr:FAD/NAD(P)-binding protein [Paracoccus aminophilus]AGT09799.1 hypothetical protein JCM7686_2743 [Paracoccus aminophilus JCM 7686]
MFPLAVSQPKVIAIIGGGFTGASVALHLARGLSLDTARIVVIEPRAALGQGLAYSTPDPNHRINVPAVRITMDCAAPGQFQAWLEQSGLEISPESRCPDGRIFAERALVGRYAEAMLAPYLADGRVSHLQGSAIAATPRADRMRLTLDTGQTLLADRVVIATSHPKPGIPGAFRALEANPRLIADPSDPARIAELARSARKILIIGSGLTSADVISSLDAQGFQGEITALSRNGLRSRGHATIRNAESPADFAENPARTALALLQRIRAAVALDAKAGLPWQATIDRVRVQGAAIWAALPQSERARLVKRLRIWWDIHRFRIAPQPEAVLTRLMETSHLRYIAAHLQKAEASPDGITVTWRARGSAETTESHFDAVILTTGPAHDSIIKASPLLASLAEAGLIEPDPLGLGLHVARSCRAVASDGQTSDRLLVAGPLARGHIGELMGIPEITAHAETVARVLIEDQQMQSPRDRAFASATASGSATAPNETAEN